MTEVVASELVGQWARNTGLHTHWHFVYAEATYPGYVLAPCKAVISIGKPLTSTPNAPPTDACPICARSGGQARLLP